MYTVRAYGNPDREDFLAHYRRSIDESGTGEPHFNPFIPGDPDRPQTPKFENLDKPVAEMGWLRYWVAVHETDGIVGHVDLKGPELRVALHRCLLGIGIERGHRGKGVGTRLMQAAIDFATAEPQLEWIDLSVFELNSPARALYERLGFREQGRVPDKFRIRGDSITDVLMALALR